MQYREEFTAANGTKARYVEGLQQLIRAREADARAVRSKYARDIFTDAERYRNDLRQMLGWPLTEPSRDSVLSVKMTLLAEEPTHLVYRASFEILDGVLLSGLYFALKEEGSHPLVLVQHGALGSPELISGFYGSTTNYNDMLERVIREGVHAFAPQLVLWEEGYGVPFNRALMDASLKRVGSSISAVEIYGLMRVLDYFEAQPNVSTLGMVGLSYGGFYTLHTAALDTRIRSAICCVSFNTKDVLHFPDWTWTNAAYFFDDAEVAALLYPRRLCIQIAKNDSVLECSRGVASFERLTELASPVGTDWVNFTVFDGTHEFCKDDVPIQQLVADLKSNA